MCEHEIPCGEPERYKIDCDERERLEDGANTDRPQLFELANQVVASAPERRWDAVVSDAIRGILVGRFLTRILLADANERGQSPPKLVHIANSRSAYEGIIYGGLSKPSRGHSRAITDYLKSMGFERALIASDIVDTGKCLQKLGAAVIKAGIIPDFAILASAHKPTTLRRKMHVTRRSEIYAVTTGVEPMLAQSMITQGLGVQTIYGMAEPQPSSAPWPWIGEVAYELYDQLADEYIQDHIR
ncbi:MAG: hypothetical protein ACHQTE_01505 [Candidatus Saccharimonadales bacterium]